MYFVKNGTNEYGKTYNIVKIVMEVEQETMEKISEIGKSVWDGHILVSPYSPVNKSDKGLELPWTLVIVRIAYTKNTKDWSTLVFLWGLNWYCPDKSLDNQ